MASEQLKEEIAAGNGMPLMKLCKLVPSSRTGKHASLSRVLRWILHGVKGEAADHRIYLEAIRTPAGWISTPAALTRFFEAITPKVGEASSGATPTVNAKKARRAKSKADAAGKKLQRLGI